YVTNVVRVPSGATQYKTLRVYQNLAVHEGGFDALVQETIDPDNNPKTTTYTYDWDHLPTGSSKPLNLAVHPDGSWEYYAGYNSFTLPTEIYSSFGDTPTPSGFPDIYSCRYTEFSYDPLTGSGDDGTEFANIPRSVKTYIKGNQVSATYMVALP